MVPRNSKEGIHVSICKLNLYSKPVENQNIVNFGSFVKRKKKTEKRKAWKKEHKKARLTLLVQLEHPQHCPHRQRRAQPILVVFRVHTPDRRKTAALEDAGCGSEGQGKGGSLTWAVWSRKTPQAADPQHVLLLLCFPRPSLAKNKILSLLRNCSPKLLKLWHAESRANELQ